MNKFSIALLALAFAAPASAGGLVSPQEPGISAPYASAPMRYDWTGPYAGLTVGFGTAHSSNGQSASGVGAAAHLGYNVDFGNWVGGVEIDAAPGALLGLSSGGRSMGNSGRLKFRAGPTLGDNGETFAYVTAGAALVNSSDGTNNFSDLGWLAGAGMSHALRSNWFVTGELIYHNFQNAAGTTNSVDGISATMGISYRF